MIWAAQFLYTDLCSLLFNFFSTGSSSISDINVCVTHLKAKSRHKSLNISVCKKKYTWHSSQQLVNILEMDKHDH